MFTITPVHEGVKNLVLQLDGVLDSSDLLDQTLVDLAALSSGGSFGTPTGLQLQRVKFTLSPQVHITVKGVSGKVLAHLYRNGAMCFENPIKVEENVLMDIGDYAGFDISFTVVFRFRKCY